MSLLPTLMPEHAASLRDRLLQIQMFNCFTQKELCNDMHISNVTLRAFQRNTQEVQIKTIGKINKYIIRKEKEMNDVTVNTIQIIMDKLPSQIPPIGE